jgi:hypothetical protein
MSYGWQRMRKRECMSATVSLGLPGLEMAARISFYLLKGSMLYFSALSIKEGLPRLREVHEGTHIRWKRRYPYLFMALLSFLLIIAQAAESEKEMAGFLIALTGAVAGYRLWIRHVVIRNPLISFGHWLAPTCYLLFLRDPAMNLIGQNNLLGLDITLITIILIVTATGLMRARKLIRKLHAAGTTAGQERIANRVFVTQELITARFSAFRIFHWLAFVLLPFGIISTIMLLLGYADNDLGNVFTFVASLSILMLCISIVLGLGLIKNTWEAIHDRNTHSHPEKIIAQMVNPLNHILPYYTARDTMQSFTGLAYDVNRYVQEKELIVPGKKLTDEEIAANYARIVVWMRFPLMLPLLIMPAMLLKYRFHSNLRDALITIVSQRQQCATQPELDRSNG